MKKIRTVRGQSGLTLPELLVIIFIVAVLASLSLPQPGASLARSQADQMLNHMKQLHLATQQMALDGMTCGDTNIGWPGDIGGSYTNWTAQIVEGNYLSTNDLAKLLSAPKSSTRGGPLQWFQMVPPSYSISGSNNGGVLVYAVTEKVDGSAVFLSTANFTNSPAGGAMDATRPLLGGKYFVVFHKAGEGVILMARQVGQTNMVGSYVPLCR